MIRELSIASLLILQISCSTETTRPINESPKINLSGHIMGSSVAIQGVAIKYHSSQDSGVAYSDSLGNYEISLGGNDDYLFSLFSLMHMDTSFLFNSTADTIVDLSLVKIDYYPSTVGSHWTYEYKYTPWDEPPYDSFIDLIIHRIIIDSSPGSIGSEITIAGFKKSYGLSDTIEINDLQYLEEPIDENYAVASFLSVPFADTSFSIVLNKYFHESLNHGMTNLELQTPFTNQLYNSSSDAFSGTTALTSSIIFQVYDGEIWIKNNVGVLYLSLDHYGQVVQETLNVRLLEFSAGYN